MIVYDQFVLCLALTFAVGLSDDWNHEMECAVWNLLINHFKSNTGFNVVCKQHQLCTGFLCNGTFIHPVSGNNDNIAFGADFLSCHEPKQLKVFVRGKKEEEISRLIDITQKSSVTTMPLPTTSGSHLLGSLTVRLIVSATLVPPNETDFAINASVYDARGVAKNSFVVIPHTRLLIPGCSSKSRYSFNQTLTGVPCVPDTMHACSNNQLCQEKQCVCVHGTMWNSDMQVCSVPGPTTSNTPSNSNHLVVIVICSLLGVLCVIVVMAMLIRYRNYRQRYGQHELLINNEGTDRDLDGGDSRMLDG